MGLGEEARLIFPNEPRGHVFGLDLAVLLFEGDRLFLVLQNVPIRAGAVGEGLITAFVHGFAGGDILERLGEVGVAREQTHDFEQDPFAVLSLADLRQRIGQLDGDLLVLEATSG